MRACVCLSEDPLTWATLALHGHMISFGDRDHPWSTNLPLSYFRFWTEGPITALKEV